MTTPQPKDWLTAYMQYTSESEPPELYRWWMGVSAIAACLQRKCYIPWTHGVLYPNMYIILTGPSGETRKGTAMGQIQPLLQQVGLRFASNAATRQALIDDMMECTATHEVDGHPCPHSSLTIFSKELTVLIGYDSREFLADLCDWYDCEDRWVKRTKSRDQEVIDGVWLNLVAATTPMTLQSAMPEDGVGGGFTSRAIFVCAKKKSKQVSPISRTTERSYVEDVQACEETKKLANGLIHIHSLRGQFLFTEAAKRVFDDWMTAEELLTFLRRPIFAGYVSRRPTHIAKLSMILSASRALSNTIEEGDVNRAISLLTTTERTMYQAFEGFGSSDLAVIIPQLKEFFKTHHKNGLVSPSHVLSYFEGMIDIETMSRALALMKGRRFIDIELHNGSEVIVLREDIFAEPN